MQKLQGEVFTGQGGCEHQDFMQDVTVHHGEGLDVGTVSFTIGDSTIVFNSADALVAELGEPVAA